MNIEIYKPLWIKIQNFPLDDANAVTNFSKKLAHNQNWSAAFTKRVTEEYKKFIFLCCISENGASPSQMVDEAWHLHLTYTQSYWVDFCKNTLGKDIHHHPSKGGSDENHRHEEWYSQTLQLYEIVFGISPPTDIWTVPVMQAQLECPQEPLVDNKIKMKAVAIMALPFLIIVLKNATANPFILRGSEFLLFYPLFCITVMLSMSLLHNHFRKKINQLLEAHFPLDASVYAMANFIYGKHRAVQAAIIDLMRRDYLSLDEDKLFTIKNKPTEISASETNPLLKCIMSEVKGSRHVYEMIFANWCDEQALSNTWLTYFSQYNLRIKNFWTGPFWIMLPFFVGIPRVIQGLVNSRPVLYLVAEMIILNVVSFFIYYSYQSGSVIKNFAKKVYRDQAKTMKFGEDAVVTNYAENGINNFNGFAETALLLSIFSPYQPLDIGRHNGFPWSNDASSSSCSGGGSCGGGGGCGGGGCGGCGGGD